MTDKTIYSLSIEDIYSVTEESKGRKPNKKEIQFVSEKIGDRIAWFDIIEDLLNEYYNDSIHKQKTTRRA